MQKNSVYSFPRSTKVFQKFSNEEFCITVILDISNLINLNEIKVRQNFGRIYKNLSISKPDSGKNFGGVQK